MFFPTWLERQIQFVPEIEAGCFVMVVTRVVDHHACVNTGPVLEMVIRLVRRGLATKLCPKSYFCAIIYL